MIELKDVLKSYKGMTALNVSSLEIKEGSSCGIVGHNGSGKTTMFKCITNIITNYEGTITIEGQVVKENNSILGNVGLVLDGMTVYQNQTGWFNIQYFAGLKGDYDQSQVEVFAKELGIYEVLKKKVKKYSYGMKKKLILLIALIHTPKILILDEPFRGLDVDSVKWFKKYLGNLIKNEELTLLISSHVLSDIEELCDEVYVLDMGRVIDHIDLKTEKEKQYRMIGTDDNDRLVAILVQAGLPYEEKEEQIKLDINHPMWAQVYKQLQEEGIEINEMSKVKVLQDKLN